MHKVLFVFMGSVTLIVLALACGRRESSSSNPLAAASPSLAITSPTATSSSASASFLRRPTVVTAMLNFPALKTLLSLFGVSETKLLAAESTAPTDVKDYATAVSELAGKLTADPTTSAAAVELTVSSQKTFQANCYGPSFAEDLSNNGTGTAASVDHPSGDTGMMYATQDNTKTQACAAAQLNALVGSESAKLAREALELLAVMLAKANSDGKALPDVSDPAVSVTLPTVTGVTFSSVTLDRLADDAGGNKVFKSIFTGTETASGKSISITFYHSPTSTDNSTFKGLMQATVPHTVLGTSPVRYRGISMVYNKTATENVFILESSANRSTESTSFFKNSNGRIDFSSAAFGEDGVRFHAVVNESTKAWAVNYSWQAGEGDGRVRSFAVKTTGSDSGDTGTAYFGFGGDIDTLTDSNFYTNGLTGINCNWINGVTSSTHTSNKAQKQTMTYTSGEFRPTASNISFAPSDDCNSTVTFTYSNPAVGAAKPSWLTSPSGAITNNLVATSGISSDIGSLTVPTFSLP